MIPLRDNIPARTTPWVNYLIIGICSVTFLVQVTSEDSQTLVEQFGMIPQRVFDPDQPVVMKLQQVVQTPQGLQRIVLEKVAAETPVNPWLTLLTCVFLHGGWLHFLGNMWFLFIFGDNVEDRLGHVAYLVFYLAAGVLASAAHLFVSADSPIPTVGASGAIAGVMGAYFLLYPRALVLSVVPIFFFIQIVALPAPLFLGIWFLLQLVQGFGVAAASGVAWWAHIGGFVVGLAVAAVLRNTGHTRPPVTHYRAGSDHVGMHSYRRSQ